MFPSRAVRKSGFALDWYLYVLCLVLAVVLCGLWAIGVFSFGGALALQGTTEALCVVVTAVHRRRRGWRWSGLTWMRIVRLVGISLGVLGLIWFYWLVGKEERARFLQVWIAVAMQPGSLYLLAWSVGLACQYKAEFEEGCKRPNGGKGDGAADVGREPGGKPASKRPRRRLHVLPFVCGQVLALLGAGAWAWGALVVTGTWQPAMGTKLPLCGIYDIAVARDGSVYCAVTWYSRIQAYGPDGRFMRG